MSFNTLIKTIEKDNSLKVIYRELELLHAKGYPSDKTSEIVKIRADFEVKKNNLVKEYLNKEINFLKTYGYKDNN
jgi:hypothetical protein